MRKIDQIKNMFPIQFHGLLSQLDGCIEELQEIRIRVSCPCLFVIKKKEYYPDVLGELSTNKHKGYRFTREDTEAIFNHICKYSPYAFENQLKQGFLTVAGGHRIGVCGQVVFDHGEVALIKQVHFLHIRIVHEICGIGQDILPRLFENNQFFNTLIISEPGAGKTTMLRDLARSISDGNAYVHGKQVCIIDERSEIAGCYMGVPQNHVGMRTDVLDACPKAVGMMMAIRAMGPEVLVVDELGLEQDYEAIRLASACGIKLLASVHGENVEDICSSQNVYEKAIQTTFQRFLVLDWKRNSAGMVKQNWRLYDQSGRMIARKEN